MVIQLVGALVIGGILLTAIPALTNNNQTEAPALIQPHYAQESAQETEPVEREELYEVVATNLRVPWDIAFLPDGDLLVTERAGTVRRIGNNPATIPIEGVNAIGEGGLLGIVLHPNFKENNYVYLYITTQSETGTINRVERFTFTDNKLLKDAVIVDAIPGAKYHDGGRMLFDSDNNLYITTGDASNPQSARDKTTLAGKILRVTSDGAIEMVSYGHRNPQGIAFHQDGSLWSTEHGRSGVLSGLDEINKITEGGDYGWPESQGDTYQPGTILPVLHSGKETWAPASLISIGNTLLFGGLRGEALYTYDIETGELQEHFKHVFGRIRTVLYNEDEDALYITTSNTDGRGKLRTGDDKVIRIPREAVLE